VIWHLPVLVPGAGTANLAISNSAMLPSGRIPVGDPQGRNVTVVDLVQGGIALLLLCLNLGDVRVEGTPLLPGPAIARADSAEDQYIAWLTDSPGGIPQANTYRGSYLVMVRAICDELKAGHTQSDVADALYQAETRGQGGMLHITSRAEAGQIVVGADKFLCPETS
jgi:Protein of unknown function (DUF732)